LLDLEKHLKKKVEWRKGVSEHTLREGLRQKGFSEGATSHISKSVRQSTGIVYEAKWAIFLSRLKLLTSKEMYSFCPKSGPPSKEIVLPIADLYPLIVEGTNCLISKR
jgi:hypothetical protein